MKRGLFNLIACTSFFIFISNAPGLTPSNFLFRLKISFTNYPAAETLSNFPALIKFEPATPYVYPFTASPAGGDLRFTDDSLTNQLNHEIESWNPDGTSFVWVQIPVFTNNGCIYAYYGNPANTNTPASSTNGSVWSAGFIGVWHLDESPTHGGGQADSTSNRFNGTFLDPNDSSSASATGLVNGANFFSGDGDQVQVPYQLALNPSTVTVEAWARVEGGTGYRSVLTSRKDGFPPRGYIFYAEPADNWSFWLANNPWDTIDGPLVSFNQFDYLTGIYDASTGNQSFYVNGQNVGSQNATYLPLNDFSFPLHIGVGGQVANQFFFNGTIDEVRVSGVPRSSNWIWATWQNIASNSLFNTLTAPVALATNLPLIGTLAPTGLVVGGAALNGVLASTGTSETVVYLYYGTNDGGTAQSAWSNELCLGTNQAAPDVLYTTNLTGLAQGVRYYYRYFATNAAGASWAYHAKDFIVPGPPLIRQTILAQFGIGTVKVSGTYSNLNRGDVTVYYGPSDGGTNQVNWADSTHLGQIDTASFSTLINGLLYGVRYYIRIYATNAFGARWTSQSQTFKPLAPQALLDPGLHVRQYNHESGPDELNPIGVLQAKRENLRSVQTADIDYTDNFAASFGGITDNTTLSLLWEGTFLPPDGAGSYSFGLNSDDDSVLLMDFNRDGIFDNGERILNHPCCGGPSNTQLFLNHRPYRIAIGYEQDIGTGHIDARWATGSETQFMNLDFIDGNAGAFYGEVLDLVGVENDPANALTASSAVINATYIGTASVLTAWAFWNTVDAGTNLAFWTNLNFVGVYSNIAQTNLSLPINGLTGNTLYYYTFVATNCSGLHWAPTTGRFRTPGGPLAVDTGIGATFAGYGVAQLNGNLVTGGQANVMIYWGRSDEGNNKSAWENALSLGSNLEGPFAGQTTNALYGQPYFYRTYASNQYDEAWSASAASFKISNPAFARFDGLQARQFDDLSGQTLVNPISTLQSSLEQGTSTQTADINYVNNIASSLPFITDDNNLAVLWEGWFRPPNGAGFYTFGLNHDDRAAIVIDLNDDGNFDNGAVYDPDELLVNGDATNGPCCGIHMASVFLEDRAYRFAVGYEQGSGTQTLQAKWGFGGINDFNALRFIDGSSGAFFGDVATNPFGVENGNAVAITQTSAVLQAEVFAGDAIYDLTLFYGPTDGGTNPFAWSNVIWAGTFTNLQIGLSRIATNLQKDTVYSYTFRATNCAEEVWAGATRTFTTDLEPTDFAFNTPLQLCGYDKAEPLTNFPVLIVLGTNIPGFNTSQFASPTGRDLRFTDDGGTHVLDYEIESWSTNGASYIWVQVEALVDSNTTIKAYWGNPGAMTPPVYTTNGAVWSEGFEGVWHLNGMAGNGDPHLDSTANRNDGSLIDGNATALVEPVGVANGSIDFAGDGDRIGVPYHLAMNRRTLTIEAWARVDAPPTSHHSVLTSRKDANQNRGYIFYMNPAGIWSFWTSDTVVWDVMNGPAANIGGWDYLAGTFEDATSEKSFRVNDQVIETRPGVFFPMVDFNFPLFIGSGTQSGGNFRFNGAIDEVRISSVARSSNWLHATYLNIASNDTFICYTPLDGVADIMLTKTASSTNLLIGTNLNYTITIINAGTGMVGGVVVTDSLPSGVTYLSSIPAAIQTNGNDYTFDLGTLAGGSTNIISINVAVTSSTPGVITNWASVFMTNVEANVANNADTAITRLPDSDGDGLANPGDPDDDNDLFDDRSERIANTDPLDPASFLWVLISRTATTDIQTLTFPTSTGRTYRIESLTNLFSGLWTSIQTNIPGTGGLRMIDRSNTFFRTYYRLGVESP